MNPALRLMARKSNLPSHEERESRKSWKVERLVWRGRNDRIEHNLHWAWHHEWWDCIGNRLRDRDLKIKRRRSRAASCYKGSPNVSGYSCHCLRHGSSCNIRTTASNRICNRSSRDVDCDWWRPLRESEREGAGRKHSRRRRADGCGLRGGSGRWDIDPSLSALAADCETSSAADALDDIQLLSLVAARALTVVAETATPVTRNGEGTKIFVQSTPLF